MSYQSLYRRYRPRKFSEIRGQDHITTALTNAVSSGTESHAYLFSGPRGTGKTSTARIFAKALNCSNLQDGEPCCECDSCHAMEAGNSYDLFELDAASNNGVESMRTLIAQTAVASPGRTKVYILDEVHMLSSAASNALLKTLEEPPDHVKFVLATTDPQKVLPTIRSRTQHFEFGLLSAEQLEAYAQWVVDDGELNIGADAIAQVVRDGHGSARDTLSALDLAVASGGVVRSAEPVDDLVSALASGDAASCIAALSAATATGREPRVLAENMVGAMRNAFLAAVSADLAHLAEADRQKASETAEQMGASGVTRAMELIGNALVDMRQAADPRIPFEVALIRVCQTPPTSGGDTSGLESRIAALEAQVATLQKGGSASPAPASQTAEQTPSAPPSAPSTPPVAAEPAAGKPDEPATGGAVVSPAGARAALRQKLDSQGSGRTTSKPPAAQPPASPSSTTAPPAPKSAAPPAETRPPAPAPEAAASNAPAQDEPVPAPETSPNPTPAPQSSPAATSSAEGGISVEAATAAVADAVENHLKGIAKAIYSGAHVVSTDGSVIVLGLANKPTVDRAVANQEAVEPLISASVGTQVILRFVDLTTVDGPSQKDAPSEPVSKESNLESDDMVDVTQLKDANVTETGIDKLAQAFPGAKIVEQE